MLRQLQGYDPFRVPFCTEPISVNRRKIAASSIAPASVRFVFGWSWFVISAVLTPDNNWKRSYFAVLTRKKALFGLLFFRPLIPFPDRVCFSVFSESSSCYSRSTVCAVNVMRKSHVFQFGLSSAEWAWLQFIHSLHRPSFPKVIVIVPLLTMCSSFIHCHLDFSKQQR